MLYKCKKCANLLLEAELNTILRIHGQENSSDLVEMCPTELENSEVFIQEDHIPSWIKVEIEQSNWTKGKLKCTKCGLKVGSFDFVSGTRCKCGRNEVLPPVHLIRSKIDQKNN